MLRFLLCLGASIWCCTIASAAEQYAGADAGFLVVSVGERADPEYWGLMYTDYALVFRSLDGKREAKITYRRNLVSGGLAQLMMRAATGREPDYKVPGKDYDGRGIVEITNLPAGDYEITSVESYAVEGLLSSSWWPASKLHIKFHVTAGAATYIGNFTAMPVAKKGWMGTHPDGAYFVVSDQNARDGEIALKKKPDLPTLEIAILDLSAEPPDGLVRRGTP